MTAMLATFTAALAVTAAYFLISGLRSADSDTPPMLTPAQWRRISRSDQTRRLSRRTWILLGAGVFGGVVVWAITGWYTMLVVLPLAAIGVPALFASENKVSIERLEAMKDWTHNLAATLSAGSGLEAALQGTNRSTPAALRKEVDTLCARLRAQVPVQVALRSFADDLDDPTGDLIASALILSAQLRSEGLVDVLKGLAQTVSDDVRNRRAVEAERAKPRTTARWITGITLGVLALLALTGSYVAPYATPLGQVLLVALLGAYAGCLIWMRKTTISKEPPRFISARKPSLQNAAPAEVGGQR